MTWSRFNGLNVVQDGEHIESQEMGRVSELG